MDPEHNKLDIASGWYFKRYKLKKSRFKFRHKYLVPVQRKYSRRIQNFSKK